MFAFVLLNFTVFTGVGSFISFNNPMKDIIIIITIIPVFFFHEKTSLFAKERQERGGFGWYEEVERILEELGKENP